MKELKEIFQSISNRELSVLLWTVIYIIYLMRKSSVRKSIFNVCRRIYEVKNTLLFMIVYVALSVFLLQVLDIYSISLLKDVFIWLIATAFVLLLDVVNIKTNQGFFTFVKKSLTFMLIFEYVINFTSFSLWSELIIVPIFWWINKTYHFDYINEPQNKSVKKIVSVLYYFFWSIWLYSAFRSITSHEEFFTICNLKAFLITPMLTLLFIPFVYVFKLIMGYEYLYKVKFHILTKKEKYEYLMKAFKKCGFNLSDIELTNEKIITYSGQPKAYLLNILNLTFNK